MTKIGERIKHYRTLRGMSAQKLSDLTGGAMSRGVIANLETRAKKDVTVTELLTLADALDVAPASLDPRLSQDDTRWRQGYEQAVRDMQARLRDLKP